MGTLSCFQIIFVVFMVALGIAATIQQWRLLLGQKDPEWDERFKGLRRRVAEIFASNEDALPLSAPDVPTRTYVDLQPCALKEVTELTAGADIVEDDSSRTESSQSCDQWMREVSEMTVFRPKRS